LVEEVFGKWPEIPGFYQPAVENMGYLGVIWYLKIIRGEGGID
jgi:hypothetical protein